jgi:hypothetical protein
LAAGRCSPAPVMRAASPTRPRGEGMAR